MLIRKIQPFFIILILLTLHAAIVAQECSNFEQIGNLGGEEGLHIQTTSKYRLLGGSFQQVANIHNNTLNSKGDSDGWLSLQDDQQNTFWAAQIASPKAIEFVDLKLDSIQNKIYALGSFSDSLWIGNQSFYSASNSIFVIQYSIQGKVLWVKIFGASHFAKPSELLISNSNIYLTGSYQDSLEIDTVSLYNTGSKNAFILKFDTTGQALWGYSFDQTRFAEGISLTNSQQGDIYWVGNFRGQLIAGQNSFEANVVYPNIFLSKLSPNGQLRWTKSFGGVYSNEVGAIRYYNNQLFLAGQFMGVLQLGQSKLATAYRYYDIFLSQLDTSANPVWATQSNSHKAHCWFKGLDINQQKIGLVGGFEDYLRIEDQQIVSKNKIDGFYGQFTTNGNLTYLQGIGSNGNDLAHSLSISSKKPLIIGTFQDSLSCIQNYIAKGYSDAFLLESSNSSNVSVITTQAKLIDATLFPSPSQDSVFIQIANSNQLHWQLYNTNGQLVLEGHNLHFSLKNLTTGFYSLLLNNEEGFAVLKVVKN
ncbi:MAG: T9SS type A sorting domain-containing protein [Aureispira sp.]|nr:T9SS type A sorting domain-containing protein [Aureispira sp.]